MIVLRSSRTILQACMVIALVVPMAACDDSTSSEPEPAVATMRLTVGSQVINVASTGTVTGGPLIVPAGGATVTATWLKADGTAETIVTSAVFQLNVTPANTAIVTFTRVSPFVGTLNRIAAGSTTAQFSLFHVAEGHNDFGPFVVPITVQ